MKVQYIFGTHFDFHFLVKFLCSLIKFRINFSPSIHSSCLEEEPNRLYEILYLVFSFLSDYSWRVNVRLFHSMPRNFLYSVGRMEIWLPRQFERLVVMMMVVT